MTKIRSDLKDYLLVQEDEPERGFLWGLSSRRLTRQAKGLRESIVKALAEGEQRVSDLREALVAVSPEGDAITQAVAEIERSNQ